MKSIFLLIAMMFFGFNAISQDLLSKYKNGTVKLKEDHAYASGTDWNNLFDDYYTKLGMAEIGKEKKMVIAPDGSVFMTHRSKHEIWKFNKDGKLLKKIGKSGNNPGEFVMLPRIQGVLSNKYVYTADVQGRMLFFDLEGNYIKQLKLDYMPLYTCALSNSKIGILGYVPVANNKARIIVAIKDFISGKENVIAEEPYDPSESSYKFKYANGLSISLSIPYTNSSLRNFIIAATKEGNLIVASPNTGTIETYSTNGDKLKAFRLGIEPLQITDEDIEENYQLMLAKVDVYAASILKAGKISDKEKARIIEDMKSKCQFVKDRKLYPEHLPYFSNLIIDSDGNCLVFEFTKKDVSNKFKVYTFNSIGEYVCSSSFENHDYNIQFNPYEFCFYDGNIYAIAEKKDAVGVPLRLVKFELER